MGKSLLSLDFVLIALAGLLSACTENNKGGLSPPLTFNNKRVTVDGGRTTHSCVADRLSYAGGSTALVSRGVGLEGAWGFAERTRGMSAAYTPAAEECQQRLQVSDNLRLCFFSPALGRFSSLLYLAYLIDKYGILYSALMNR